MDTTSSARNPGIDTLRGLSILLVVTHHLSLRIPLRKTGLSDWLPDRLLAVFSSYGYEAVFVFFVISGFLITSRSLLRWGSLSKLDARRFYLSRAARILPCLLALLVILSAMHLAGVPDYVIDKPTQSLPGALASAVGLYLNWYEGQTGWLPGGWDVLWSLSIEELFYLGFPLACLVVRSERVLVALLVALAASMPFTHAALAANEIWQEKAWLPGMSAIAIGVIAAIVAARIEPTRASAHVMAIVGAAGVVAIFGWGDLIWNLVADGYLLVLTMSVAVLVVGLDARQREEPTPGLRVLAPLRSLGRISYEVYLTHMFIVFGVVAIYVGAGRNVGTGHWWFVPVVAACWLLGLVVARGFSQPCDRALRGRMSVAHAQREAGR